MTKLETTCFFPTISTYHYGEWGLQHWILISGTPHLGWASLGLDIPLPYPHLETIQLCPAFLSKNNFVMHLNDFPWLWSYSNQSTGTSETKSEEKTYEKVHYSYITLDSAIVSLPNLSFFLSFYAKENRLIRRLWGHCILVRGAHKLNAGTIIAYVIQIFVCGASKIYRYYMFCIYKT